MNSEPKRTALIAAASVVIWLAIVMATMQIAYSFDLYWLMERDFEAGLIALAGLGITLLIVFDRSPAEHGAKVTIGVCSLASFFVLNVIGGLYVACANGNCL